MFDPDEVCGIARVQPGTVDMSGCCDQQIHHPWARLSTNARHCCCELAIADRNVVIHGERVEPSLQLREPS